MATKATILAEINTNFPDNTTGAITPALQRTTHADEVNSWQQAPSINTQGGASYTIVAADYGQMVLLTSNASPAVTLPAASAPGFFPFNVLVKNNGTGIVTITPAGGSIDGAATLQLTSKQASWLISDGTNWFTGTFSLGPGAAPAPVSASYITVTSDPTLTAERVLTADNGISITDQGSVVGTIKVGVNVVNEAADTTCFPAFFTSATGVLAPSTNANLTYNAATGAFSIGITQALTAGTIELGHAFDTTLARVAAGGDVTIENNIIYRAAGTDVALADGGTGASLSSPGIDRLLMWDQGTNGVVFGTLASITTQNSPTTGDFVLLQKGGTDDLQKVNWSSLPGAAGGTLAFGTISVSGQSDVVADAAPDILTLVAGTNITITTNALTDTITINSTAGGGGAPVGASYVTLSADATLTAERVLTGGTGVSITDQGVITGTVTVAIDTAVVPVKTDNLSVFAATTSAQLAGVISDETGSGLLVFGTSPTLTTPKINDSALNNTYSITVADLAANRNIALPLLTADDTFVFQAFTQTLTNKTIDLTNNTLTGTVAQFNAALAAADFYTTGGTAVALADGGTGTSLTTPGIDRLLMWDQGSGHMAFGQLANITTQGAPASGDFVLIQKGGTDDLQKVDWANLPGSAGSTLAFGTFAVSGQSNVVASVAPDTVTLVAGTNIGLTTNAGTKAITIATSGLAAGATSALATTGEVWAGTASTLLTPLNVLNALAAVGLTFGATISVDLALGVYFTVTLTGAATLGNPTNPKVGRTIYFRVSQDGTGTRTLAYGSNYDFGQDSAPTLTTAGSAQDLIAFFVSTTTKLIYLGIRQNIG